MASVSNQLRSQLADFFDEVSDQLSLRSLSGVGCAQRIYAPTFRLSACDQCADACNFMKRVLGEARALCCVRMPTSVSQRLREKLVVALAEMSSGRSVAARLRNRRSTLRQQSVTGRPPVRSKKIAAVTNLHR